MAKTDVEQKSRKIPSFNWEWNVLLAIIEILPQNKFSSTIQQHVIAKCFKTGWLDFSMISLLVKSGNIDAAIDLWLYTWNVIIRYTASKSNLVKNILLIILSHSIIFFINVFEPQQLHQNEDKTTVNAHSKRTNNSANNNLSYSFMPLRQRNLSWGNMAIWRFMKNATFYDGRKMK